MKRGGTRRRAAVPDCRDRGASTAVSVGPMHGVQPIAEQDAEAAGAPASPAFGMKDGLEHPAGEHEPVRTRPKNSSPSHDRHRAEYPGEQRVVRAEQLAGGRRPARPVREKTAEKPATKQRRARDGGRPVCRAAGAGRLRPGPWVVTPPSAPANTWRPRPSVLPGDAFGGGLGRSSRSRPRRTIPVMYARYPGTSGRQHGERNVTAPAAAATGMASSSGPDDTRLMTLIRRVPFPFGTALVSHGSGQRHASQYDRRGRRVMPRAAGRPLGAG